VLYVRGGGDPILMSEELARLATELQCFDRSIERFFADFEGKEKHGRAELSRWMIPSVTRGATATTQGLSPC
jgi:hypothetical protein